MFGLVVKEIKLILTFKDKKPKIGKNVFIAHNAVIIGDVEIGDNCSIWYNAVIRGDMAPIRIGENTNIQDNCTVHVDENVPTTIGNLVTIGHNAVIHGCKIEDLSLIGMNSTLLNHCLIKKGSIVGSNAVVKEKAVVGPYQLVAGVPAKLVKELPENIIEITKAAADSYITKINQYKKYVKVADQI